MIGVSMLASAAGGPALGQEKPDQQIAEIEIDPAQLGPYRGGCQGTHRNRRAVEQGMG